MAKGRPAASQADDLPSEGAAVSRSIEKQTFASLGSDDRNGSILVIRGMTAHSVIPSDRNRPRLCEKSKCRRIRGYFDPYLLVDRGLQGILRGRILKTNIRYDFSHSLGHFETFSLDGNRV